MFKYLKVKTEADIEKYFLEDFYCKMELAEKRINGELRERIELFGLNHRDICFFGAEGDCDEICYEKIEYCAIGEFTKCTSYREKLERMSSR